MKWKLENELNDKEIEMIMEKDLATARELVCQKQSESEIYIGYLRKEADRLDSQLELLETRLKQKEDQVFMDKMDALTKGKTVIANRARNNKRQGLSTGRQHLMKKH